MIYKENPVSVNNKQNHLQEDPQAMIVLLFTAIG